MSKSSMATAQDDYPGILTSCIVFVSCKHNLRSLSLCACIYVCVCVRACVCVCVHVGMYVCVVQ